jgi:acyl-ACP thioesterase
MGHGRVFGSARTVRGGDVNADGRLRLDALARYLQDVAEDDVADAGLREPQDWVLRRCALTIGSFPGLGQALAVRTFCSGIGPRWAERTTTLASDAGELVRATAVWVAVARDTGGPVSLGPEFHRVYGASAGGRSLSARLSHPRPPGPRGPRCPSLDGGRPWPLRATDFDASGHVNNTVHWAAVEDALAGLGWLPASTELEYRRPVLPGLEPQLLVSPGADQAWAWLLDGTEVLASARLGRPGRAGLGMFGGG